MTLAQVVDVFKEIQATSSRTVKEVILKANKDNEKFRKILEFIYNPFILTGIKGKKLQKFEDYFDDELAANMDEVLPIIKYISKNNSGRDEDVKLVATFINNHTFDDEREFLKEMFTKTFKCGITASTINKVYGKGTIPEFDVLLAKAYKDHGHKLKGKFFVTLKLDGIRCVAIKKGGTVQFFTRQGQPIDDLVDVEAELLAMPFDDFVFDGELVLKPNGMNSADLFRATQKVVRKDGIKQGLDFHVFDGLPIDEFMDGKSKLGYEARRNVIESGLFKNAAYDHVNHLKVLYEGDDKDVISDLLAEVIAEGYEGLMINTAKGLYVTKRSDVLLKVKEMHTVDLKVAGFERGEGKYSGTLGALIVDYKGHSVKVGSGYTDEDRDLIWAMQVGIIGRVVEVQYFEESSNQDGGISLRFPVFKALREMGKEVSYD